MRSEAATLSTERRMNPVDWPAVFRSRASSADSVPFEPRWLREFNATPQLLLDYSARRDTVAALHRAGMRLLPFLPRNRVVVLVYRIVTSTTSSLALMHMSGSDVRVTLLTLMGGTDAALEELYATDRGAPQREFFERDLAVAVTRAVALNTAMRYPTRQYSDTDVADTLDEYAESNIAASHDVSAALVAVVRALSYEDVGIAAAVAAPPQPPVPAILQAAHAVASDASLITPVARGTALLARLPGVNDNLYGAARLLDALYNAPAELVRTYLPVEQWPPTLLPAGFLVRRTIQTVSGASGRRLGDFLLRLRRAIRIIETLLTVSRPIAFVCTDREDDNDDDDDDDDNVALPAATTDSFRGLLVASTDGVSLVQVAQLIDGTRAVRRSTLLSGGDRVLVRVAPRGVPLEPSPGTYMAPRLTTVAGNTFAAPTPDLQTLATDDIDAAALERGATLGALMPTLANTRSADLVTASLGKLALAKALATVNGDYDRSVLLSALESLPQADVDLVRRLGVTFFGGTAKQYERPASPSFARNTATSTAHCATLVLAPLSPTRVDGATALASAIARDIVDVDALAGLFRQQLLVDDVVLRRLVGE